MKAYQEDKAFKPVTLVLETQAEVQLIFKLLSGITDDDARNITGADVNTWACYRSLFPYAARDDIPLSHIHITVTKNNT